MIWTINIAQEVEVKIFGVGINETTLAFLQGKGFSVTIEVIRTVDDLYNWIVGSTYEAIIMDLDTTDLGIFAVRYLRSRNILAPIIALSKGQKSEEPWSEQRALFLESGGDDFIRNPTNPRELAASITATVRRSKNIALDIREIKVGGATISVNLTVQQFKVNHQIIRLTTTEFRMLELLIRHPGFIKSRDDIMDAAYSDSMYVDDRTIDSHIKRIRRKLRIAHPDAANLIHTIYGAGYKIPIPSEKTQ